MTRSLSGLARLARERSGSAAVALLVVFYLLGSLLPVYADEISWRFSHRAAIDGGVDISGNDMCGPASLTAAPWFMMPARWFSAATNSLFAAPVFVRLAGVICAIAWLVLLLRLIRQVYADAAQRNVQTTLAVALLTLGWLPLIMVMSRPEQPIILATVLILSLALAPAPHGRRALWWRNAAIVALATVELSYHPKGMLYSGIAMVAIWVGARGRETLAVRLGFIAALVAIDAWALQYWLNRLACPGDPVLASKWALENVGAVASSGGAMPAFVSQLRMGLNFTHYVALAVPSNWPMSEWIADHSFASGPLPPLALAIQLAWLVALMLTCVHALRFVAQRRFDAAREPRLLLGLAIGACVLVWGTFQINRNVYEAAHMLPMVVMGLLLLNALPVRGSAVWGRAWQVLGLVVLVAALASQLFVLGSVLPGFARAAHTPGYLAAQPFSVSVGDYRPVARDMDIAMARAGFPRDRRLHRVLVDSVTYLHLQQSYRPFERQAVLGPLNGSIADPLAYLRSRGSDGAVVGCMYLSPALRQVATQVGDVCAISLARQRRTPEAGAASVAAP